MNYEDLTVVITTFHSEDKIYKCLDSIDKDLKILVVDNANDLNFKNKIEKKYQNIKFILSGENLGYAKGNNLGLSKVKSKYLEIACGGEKSLKIVEIQREGKKVQKIGEFMLGSQIRKGSIISNV